ncbi:MAG: hypothetical protein RJA98_222 [Pseudomonadota bacterium]|jgi:integrase
MVFTASNLTLRGGIYYFRARIPTPLVAAYGREIVSVSLHTTDPAVARLRAREKRLELDRALQALEHGTAPRAEQFRGTALHMTDAEIEQFCEVFRETALENDEAARIKGMQASSRELDIDMLEAGLPLLREAFALGELSAVYPELEAQMKALGLSLSTTSPSYEKLARRFQQVDVELQETLLQRRRGVIVAVPRASTNELSIRDVYKCWLRQKTRDAKTARSFEQAFENLEALCSVKAARLLQKANAVHYRNALQDGRKLSARTIEKQLTFLRAAWQCAVNDNLLDANPWVGVKVALDDERTESKSRLPFDIAELNKLFKGEVYKPWFEPRPSLGNACYWLPLLALFTGARVEELAQMTRGDVKQDPEHGWYLSIRPEAQTGKRVKTASSIRNVAMHPEILRLGFLAHVEKLKPQDRIFPALRPDKYGKLATVFSTWWGRYSDECEVTDSRKVFHSFRHTFIQVCKTKAKAIPPEVREAIVGHLAAGDIEQTYGDALYPLEPQVAAMQEVEYKGLDLSHLYPAAKPGQA